MIKALASILLVSIAFVSPAQAHDEIPGPVTAQILRVIDGDTLLVEAMPWPQQRMEVYVRIRGIDAPELHSTCQRIRTAAGNARDALEMIASRSPEIRLTRISGDKYFGRVVADVVLASGEDTAEDLLRAGLVEPYDGGRKSVETCDLP